LPALGVAVAVTVAVAARSPPACTAFRPRASQAAGAAELLVERASA
jgi:hypothetical protein